MAFTKKQRALINKAITLGAIYKNEPRDSDYKNDTICTSVEFDKTMGYPQLQDSLTFDVFEVQFYQWLVKHERI